MAKARTFKDVTDSDGSVFRHGYDAKGNFVSTQLLKSNIPTIKACIKAGTHMLRCTGDGYCKVCYDRRDYEPDLLSFNVETGEVTPHPERS